MEIFFRMVPIWMLITAVERGSCSQWFIKVQRHSDWDDAKTGTYIMEVEDEDVRRSNRKSEIIPKVSEDTTEKAYEVNEVRNRFSVNTDESVSDDNLSEAVNKSYESTVDDKQKSNEKTASVNGISEDSEASENEKRPSKTENDVKVSQSTDKSVEKTDTAGANDNLSGAAKNSTDDIDEPGVDDQQENHEKSASVNEISEDTEASENDKDLSKTENDAKVSLSFNSFVGNTGTSVTDYEQYRAVQNSTDDIDEPEVNDKQDNYKKPASVNEISGDIKALENDVKESQIMNKSVEMTDTAGTDDGQSEAVNNSADNIDEPEVDDEQNSHEKSASSNEIFEDTKASKNDKELSKNENDKTEDYGKVSDFVNNPDLNTDTTMKNDELPDDVNKPYNTDEAEINVEATTEWRGGSATEYSTQSDEMFFAGSSTPYVPAIFRND